MTRDALECARAHALHQRTVMRITPTTTTETAPCDLDTAYLAALVAALGARVDIRDELRHDAEGYACGVVYTLAGDDITWCASRRWIADLDQPVTVGEAIEAALRWIDDVAMMIPPTTCA